MPNIHLRRIRTLIRYGFYVACVIVVVLPILIIFGIVYSVRLDEEKANEDFSDEYWIQGHP